MQIELEKPTSLSMSVEEHRELEERHRQIVAALDAAERRRLQALDEESLLVHPGSWFREEVFDRFARLLRNRLKGHSTNESR